MNTLDVDVRLYSTLGACKSPFACTGLQTEEQSGQMLRRNVIVYVNDDNETVVAAIDSMASMKAVKHDMLAEVAETDHGTLTKVIVNNHNRRNPLVGGHGCVSWETVLV
jgi:bifunctional DNase/RNase